MRPNPDSHRPSADQDASLFGDLRPVAAGPGAPTPVEAESCAMPTDDGFGLDEDLCPTGPAGRRTVKKIRSSRCILGGSTLAFEHSELLAQGEDLEGSIKIAGCWA